VSCPKRELRLAAAAAADLLLCTRAGRKFFSVKKDRGGKFLAQVYHGLPMRQYYSNCVDSREQAARDADK
jgi:hypothetical protein